MSKELFEYASRNKLRFDSPKGLLSVEDLWDIPLTSMTGKANLDDVAKGLANWFKTTDATSFVNTTSTNNAETMTTQNKFDIVKYIIGVRLDERNSAMAASDRAAKKQQILGLIAQKENEALAGNSLEDLKKLADSL